MRSILDELGCKYGTEKASNAPGCKHNYLPFYEQFLAPLRDQPITLLEIGVDKGNSLRMWCDYFLRGKIVGMDCVDKTHLISDRISIFTGDQNQEADLDKVAELFGPFDVIVDDAGHDPPSQAYCHRHMLQYVKPGGLYILEDLVGLSGPFQSPACTDYLTILASQIMQFEMSQIESIAFSYGTSVTRTKVSI
jgi:demethylmacrocin O-methyltransferase